MAIAQRSINSIYFTYIKQNTTQYKHKSKKHYAYIKNYDIVKEKNKELNEIRHPIYMTQKTMLLRQQNSPK